MTLSRLARRWSEAAANPLTEATAAAQQARDPLLNLITPSSAETGLEFPFDALREITTRAVAENSKVRSYAPDPLGQRAAREAIAAHFVRRGVTANADHVCLTPGTSTAYLYAFRLIADPGDDILVPSPGYPLFDDIASICGLRLRRYHLRDTARGWRPDLEEVAFQCTARTRGIVVISPHNPTGTVWSEGELDDLRAVCAERDLTVIFDEVFGEFLTPPASCLPRPRGFPLCLSLNGLSKMLALPAWKVGWMRIDGDSDRSDAFLRSLEHISDTFLPVPELQQAMIPDLIEEGDPEVINSLAGAISQRRQFLIDSLDAPPPLPDGGAHMCHPLPDGVDDEEFAVRLVQEDRVLVHPGHYYGLPRHLVLTCLPRPDALREGARRINAAVG